MVQSVQALPLQTIQINDNNEIGGCMSMQLGVINSPTVGVPIPQSHAHIRNWIALQSQSSINYPSLVDYVHDSKEYLLLSTNAGQSTSKRKAMCPSGTKWLNKDGIANTFSLASMIKCHRENLTLTRKRHFL